MSHPEGPAVSEHFSRDPRAYATFRPHYPPGLFAWLADLVSRHDLAWDCATGTGQAALGLAEHFARVFATDASAAQVSVGEPHPRVEYRVAPAHASGLPARTVDLVTVAQALHWIEPATFYSEARRVAAPGAAIAAWTYGLPVVAPGVDRLLGRFYRETVGAYWPAERRHVETGYAELSFPFERIPAPEFVIESGLTLEGILGYVGTWSATHRFIEARGEDPVPALRATLAGEWGGPESVRAIRWPLAVLAGRLG